MKIIGLLILLQAVIVFVILISLLMDTLLINVQNSENSSIENGYLPVQKSVDFLNLPKITILYLVITVLEIIIIFKVFG